MILHSLIICVFPALPNLYEETWSQKEDESDSFSHAAKSIGVDSSY